MNACNFLRSGSSERGRGRSTSQLCLHTFQGFLSFRQRLMFRCCNATALSQPTRRWFVPPFRNHMGLVEKVRQRSKSSMESSLALHRSAYTKADAGVEPRQSHTTACWGAHKICLSCRNGGCKGVLFFLWANWILSFRASTVAGQIGGA